MSHTTKTCLVAALVLAAAAQPRTLGQKSKSLPVPLCSITAAPEKFDGKQITIEAHYESDGMHGSILAGDNCSRGMGISAPHPYRGEKAFERAINTGGPGTLDKVITGIFVGIFKWQPEKNPKAILIVKEVRDVSLTPK